MSKHFYISGYWIDDVNDFFENYLVREYDDDHPNVDVDELIFYYGLNEEAIVNRIKEGAKTEEDFVITSYKEVILVEDFLKEHLYKFPNGFSSWYETFYEISLLMQKYLELPIDNLARETEESFGIGGIYELTKSLTDGFEKNYKDISEESLENSADINYYELLESYFKNEILP